MKIFAIADTHLALNTPGKSMEVFGADWDRYVERLESNWTELVAPHDLVLLPGDLSWATKLEESRVDLEFLGKLPGRLVLSRGNHDYWWSSLAKLKRSYPEFTFVNASATRIEATPTEAGPTRGVAIAGTRLWDVPGIDLGPLHRPPSEASQRLSKPQRRDPEQDEKLFRRELDRLQRALTELDSVAQADDLRIVMVHYPPTDADCEATEVTSLLEQYQVQHVVFGHLHNLKSDLPPGLFGTRKKITYHLVSADYLSFRPRLIAET